MKNVTMDNPLTTQEIYDELFNFKESLKKLAGDFGELANGIMLSLAKTESGERNEEIQGLKYAENILDSILREQEECGE